MPFMTFEMSMKGGPGGRHAAYLGMKPALMSDTQESGHRGSGPSARAGRGTDTV